MNLWINIYKGSLIHKYQGQQLLKYKETSLFSSKRKDTTPRAVIVFYLFFHFHGFPQLYHNSGNTPTSFYDILYFYIIRILKVPILTLSWFVIDRKKKKFWDGFLR